MHLFEDRSRAVWLENRVYESTAVCSLLSDGSNGICNRLGPLKVINRYKVSPRSTEKKCFLNAGQHHLKR